MTDDELCDVDAERKILGALMLADSPLPAEMLTLVDERDFYRGGHRTVFDAIRAVSRGGKRPDLTLVADELERRAQLGHVGGIGYLSGMIGDAPPRANLPHYAKRVREFAKRRKVDEGGGALKRAARDLTTDIDAETREACGSLLATNDRRGLVSGDDVADEFYELHGQGRRTRGVSTGWASVDRIYRPAPGMFTVLLAWPGHGKSALLNALTVNLADRHGWRFVVWTPEAGSIHEHMAQLVSVREGRDFDAIPAPDLEEPRRWVSDHFEWVDWAHHRKLGEVLAYAEVAHERRPIDGLIIDPWTELDQSRAAHLRSDEQLNADISQVTTFAKRLDVSVWAAAHPKQAETQSGGLPLPTSKMIKGGSHWRDKADAFLALWRDDEADDGSQMVAQLHVQKVRRNGIDGEMGRMTSLRFDPPSGRYFALAHMAEVA